MNGLEKITSKIIAEANEAAGKILAEASAGADLTKAKYAEQAKVAYDRVITRSTAESDGRIHRERLSAQLEGRKVLLGLKQEKMERAYADALAGLQALSGPERLKFLTDKAVGASFTGTEELILNESDRAALGEAVTKAANEALSAAGRPSGLTLSEETHAASGGLILRRGDIQINCTFEALLEQARARLDADVAKILFG